MSNASMTFGRPTRLAIPRGSVLLGTMASALISALRRLDNWQLRSLREEPKTAAALLDWADRIEAREPGFASDLRAAALRSMGSDKP